MRCLPRISGKSVFAGDVVAFKPPPGVDGDLLIRRVAAVEGEEMISDDPEDKAFYLKPGMLFCRSKQDKWICTRLSWKV